MSQTSNSSRRDRVRQRLRPTVRLSVTRDQEPVVRQRAAMMGHPPSPRHDDFAFPLTRPLPRAWRQRTRFGDVVLLRRPARGYD